MSRLDKIKRIQKEMKKQDIPSGLCEPDVWISTGNYALNWSITSDFKKGISNRKVTMLCGESGAGKSLLGATIAKNAQDLGYLLVVIDTEGGLDKDFLTKINVDMSPENFLSYRPSTLEEVTQIMSSMFNTFEEDDKICYLIDSLTMLGTTAEREKFDKGELQVDMGLFAKRAKQLVKNMVSKIGSRDNFMIITNHTYLNQDIKNGKGVQIISGGQGIQYIPSTTLLLTKLKLKEGKDIVGIRMRSEVIKSRFNQLGIKVNLEIPYQTGIDPFEGLLDIAVKSGVVDNSKKGWYSINGDDSFRGKDFHKYAGEIFDLESNVDIIEPDNI